MLQSCKGHLKSALQLTTLQEETGIFTDAQYHLGTVNSQLSCISTDEKCKLKFSIESISAFQQSQEGCKALGDTAGSLTCLQKVINIYGKVTSSPEKSALSREMYASLELAGHEIVPGNVDEDTMQKILDLIVTVLNWSPDYDVPWQETILTMASKLQASEPWQQMKGTTNEKSVKLHQVLSEVYGERLIGNIEQNLWICAEHAEASIRGYITLNKPDDFALEVLRFSNYLEALMELNDESNNHQLKTLHEKVLGWLENIIDGSIYKKESQDLAKYHHAVLNPETAPETLEEMLCALPEEIYKLVEGRAHAWMGN